MSRYKLLAARRPACNTEHAQPELGGHVGEAGGWPCAEDSPVVDPFAEAVGVEDGAEED